MAPVSKTHDADVRQVGDSLDRWYAERGSREFPGVFVFPPLKPPPIACWCGEPGKLAPAKDARSGRTEVLCAGHYVKVIG